VRIFFGLCYLAVEPLQVQHTNIEANRPWLPSGILRDRSQGDTQTSGPTHSVRWDVCNSVLFWIYCVDKCPRQDAEGERIEVRNCVLEQVCILSALIVLVLLQPQNRDRSSSRHAHGFLYGQGENSSVEANYLHSFSL